MKIVVFPKLQKMNSLTVVIVNYNVKFYLEQCLNSLKRAMEGIDAEIIVVDNDSKDGSVDYLRERFPDVNIIASNRNLGFAKANNIAIMQTESKYVLLLNPDTIVGEGVIRDSLHFMDAHDDAGGLGVRMLRCDGMPAMESRRGLPSPMTAFYKMTGLCDRFPQNRKFGRYYMSYLAWDEPCEIEVISGAYCLLRREALDKVGLLDEDFFMYGEDIDLSYRILKGGYKNWYIPVDILHYKGESTQKSSFKYVHVFYEAMLIFFKKHYRHLGFWISIPIKSAIYMKATLALVNMQAERVRRSLGFSSSYKSNDCEFVFIGSEMMLEKCRILSKSKGIKGTFIEGNNETMPKGHNGIDMIRNKKVVTYVVYDTSSFGYENILKFFSMSPEWNIKIGTFDINSNKIITGEEIFG